MTSQIVTTIAGVLWLAATCPAIADSVEKVVAETSASTIRLYSFVQEAEAGILKAGTPVTVVLKEALRGGRDKNGRSVSFAVASDVLAPNGRDVILRAGTPAYGTVRESGGAGMFGKGGKLKITCDYVAAADGARVPLRPAAKRDSIGRTGTNLFPAAIITGIVVFVPTFVGLEISINGLGIGGGRGNSPVPLIASLGAGVISASFWRGGGAVLPEGRTFQMEVAADVAPSERSGAKAARVTAVLEGDRSDLARGEGQ